MVYVAKIMLIFLGIVFAWAGGMASENAALPKGSAGSDWAALALVLLMVGAFL